MAVPVRSTVVWLSVDTFPRGLDQMRKGVRYMCTGTIPSVVPLYMYFEVVFSVYRETA